MKREPEAMTGAEVKRLREEKFQLTQLEMAELLGIGHRTYIRFEGKAFLRKLIPLHHAKHVRCLLKALPK